MQWCCLSRRVWSGWSSLSTTAHNAKPNPCPRTTLSTRRACAETWRRRGVVHVEQTAHLLTHRKKWKGKLSAFLTKRFKIEPPIILYIHQVIDNDVVRFKSHLNYFTIQSFIVKKKKNVMDRLFSRNNVFGHIYQGWECQTLSICISDILIANIMHCFMKSGLFKKKLSVIK